MTITFSRSAAADIKNGIYSAKFLGCEEGPEGNYGPTARWNFEIQDEDTVVPLDALTGLKAGPRSKAGQFLAAIIGRQLEVGESIDPDTLIGKKVKVLIEQNEKGYPTISKLMPAK